MLFLQMLAGIEGVNLQKHRSAILSGRHNSAVPASKPESNGVGALMFSAWFELSTGCGLLVDNSCCYMKLVKLPVFLCAVRVNSFLLSVVPTQVFHCVGVLMFS